MNFIQRIKMLPTGTRRLLSLGIIFALVVALPLFVWGILFGNFNLNKKAVSGEPGACLPVGKTIIVTQQPAMDDGGCHDIQVAINSVTGDGYKVQINPGIYNVYQTISVNGKSNIDITGDPNAGSGASNIHFISNGYGFNVTNSSGNISWLTMNGTTPNGAVSINDSNNFGVGYININALNSHAVDIHNSNHVSIYNADIVSTAGAVEVGTSNNISIMNTKIHNSANAISVYDSTYVSVGGNLIYGNRESALELSNIQHFQAVNNTMTNNSYGVPQNGTVKISGNTGNDYSFYRNIISAGAGAGIQIVNGQTIGIFERNDVYANNPNYSGYPNQTGIYSNISSDPLLDSNNFLYCPLITSPVIFGDYVNNGSNAFMGYIAPCSGTGSPYPTPTPIATPTPYGSPTPLPTATPSPQPQVLNFLIKFAGVTDGSADGAKVVATFQSLENTYSTPALTAYYQSNGIYQIAFAPSTPLPNVRFVQTSSGQQQAEVKYIVSLKGEKHLKTKFCTKTGIITRCSETTNPSDGISFDARGGTWDFTAFPLEPGDLYPQDGIANGADFTKIKDLLNKTCASLTNTEKLTADLDYNGCVNVRDAFLMRQTLQTRYDEN